MTQEKNDRAVRRHKRFFMPLMRLLSPPLKWLFKMTADEELARIEGPYLMLANHNTDWDPLLVSVALRHHLYFVASEHIFRKGFLSRLLVYFLDPIPRTKGNVESAAAMAVLRRLRKGNSVGIFAEGNRSFNGLTTRVHPSTAKLVRSAGVKLITLRMQGGYLTTPRWGKGIRRGGMHIALVGVYEPEQLKSMSAEEIDALLRRDLYEDAYARQKEADISYKRRRDRAHFMETALFLCPACGAVGTLRSAGHDITCACGLRATYTEKGYLEGNAPYDTVTEWDIWQRKALEKRLAAAGSDEPLFTDEGAVLCRYGGDHNETARTQGTLRLFADRMEVGQTVLPLGEIGRLSIYGRNHLAFTFDGTHCEIHGHERYNALKYLYAYEIATHTASIQTVRYPRGAACATNT